MIRIAALVIAAVFTALLAAGCGEDATTSTTRTEPVRVTPDVDEGAKDREVLRDETADLDGWTDTSWVQLGGRPEDWPVDLVPPLATERATLRIDRDSSGESLILSGRVPTDPDTLEMQLRDSFASWEAVEGVGVEDVIGTWERDGSHVTVTVREDNGDTGGATYGFIRRDA